MREKYKIEIVIFIVCFLFSINLFAISYSSFDDTSINYTSVGGAFESGIGSDKTIALPIQEYYAPPNAIFLPKFKLKSQSSDEINYSYLNSPIYQTDYYDLGVENESEHFLLSYSGYSRFARKYYIDIYYLPTFYSKLPGKEKNKTNISLNLNVNLTYKSNNGAIHQLYRVASNRKSSKRYEYNLSDFYYYSSFYMRVASRYNYIPNFLEFYFTWDPTTLQSVNNYSVINNNGYKFVSKEPVFSNVIFEITAI